MRPESRSPAARLIRARALSTSWETTKAHHVYEDRMVVAYAKFLRELDSLDGIQQERYLALHPVMAEVHYLAGPSDSRMLTGGQSRWPSVLGLAPAVTADLPTSAASKDRALVRAFVLGNLPVEQIADILDFRPEAIQTYESLAFDVRSRLSKKAWLHNYVFGDSLLATTSALDFERLCLLTVYKHGVEALKRLLFLGDLSEFVTEMRKQLQVDMAAKAGLSLATMPLNSHTMPELVTGYNNWDKTERDLQIKERQQGAGTDTDSDFQASLMQSLRDVGCSIHEPAVDSSKDNPAEEYQPDQAFVLALSSVLKEMHLEEAARG